VSDAVLYDLDAAGVARITLNRPAALNAIGPEMFDGLVGALDACRSDRVRCVLLTGAGRAFCAGGDLKMFAEADDLSAVLLDVVERFHVVILGLARLDAPVVAAVHGSAAGGGFSLACAADILVASASARFLVGYSAIGMSPDGGGTYVLPRLVGLGRALDLALLNPALTADEAAAAGIVSRVFPDESFEREAAELAARLAAGPTRTLAATKRLLRGSWHADLEQQLEAERLTMAELGGTEDGREGIRAFVEKRAPRYTGR
jgi:2-(1,2-epoxy-1,2-dihydrophenyl)acetyl-CoA isomerase